MSEWSHEKGAFQTHSKGKAELSSSQIIFSGDMVVVSRLFLRWMLHFYTCLLALSSNESPGYFLYLEDYTPDIQGVCP